MSIEVKNSIIFVFAIFPFLINGILNASFYQTPLIYWSLELVYWLVVPSICLLIYLRIPENNFNKLGLHSEIFYKKDVKKIWLTGLILFPVLLVVYLAALNISWKLLPIPPVFSYRSVIPESLALKSLVIVYFAFTAGFVEEVLFRGLLYSIISNPVYYIIVSSTTFSLIHWESGLSNVLATFVIGGIMAYIYFKLKNLWPLIIAHVCMDLTWFFR